MGVSFSPAGSARDRRIDMEVGRTVLAEELFPFLAARNATKEKYLYARGKFPSLSMLRLADRAALGWPGESRTA